MSELFKIFLVKACKKKLNVAEVTLFNVLKNATNISAKSENIALTKKKMLEIKKQNIVINLRL